MADEQQLPRILVAGRPAGLEDDTHTPEFTAADFTSVPCALDSPAVPDEAPECLEDDPVFQAFVTWLDRREKHQPCCSRTLQPPDDPSQCLPTMRTKVGVQAATPVLTSPLSDETALLTAVTSMTVSVGKLTATLEALRQPSLQPRQVAVIAIRVVSRVDAMVMYRSCVHNFLQLPVSSTQCGVRQTSGVKNHSAITLRRTDTMPCPA